MHIFFRNKGLLFFLLIPFFKPICFKYITKLLFIEKVFVTWKIVSAVIVLVLFFIYIIKYFKIPKIILYIFIFEFLIFISTIINNGYLYRAVIDMVSIVAFCVIIYMGIQNNVINLFKSLSLLCTILMFINLFSMILYPDGIPADLYTNKLNPIFFMTTDNGTGVFIITTMLFVVISNNLKKSHKPYIVELILSCCLLCAFFSGSTTSMVICFFFIIYLGIFFRKNKKITFNPIVLSISYLILSVMIISGLTNIFMLFVEGILHKSITFTGRNQLWHDALQLIKSKFWIGYGRINGDYISIWGGRYSSHNILLELLLEGGVITLLLFTLINYKAVKILNIYINLRIANILSIGLFLIFIALMMEAFVHEVYLYGILIISCEIPVIIDKYNHIQHIK